MIGVGRRIAIFIRGIEGVLTPQDLFEAFACKCTFESNCKHTKCESIIIRSMTLHAGSKVIGYFNIAIIEYTSATCNEIERKLVPRDSGQSTCDKPLAQ